LRIAVRTNQRGFRAVAEVGERIEAVARESLGASTTAEASGFVYILGDWLSELVQGQRNGLITCAMTVAILMIVCLRSFRVGLWSMVPNLLPVLAIAGLLGFLWEHADSDCIGLGILAIGIGVDDTIHFLTRYRIEAARSVHTAEAIRRTFAFAGRAIVMTTVILAAGFCPFALSDYLTTRILGTMLPFCLVVALAADVLLVPAMVQLGWMRYEERSPTPLPPAPPSG
jgi:predicted RND superfamily exporter protein